MKETGRVTEILPGAVVIETAVHDECTKCCSCKGSKPQRIEIAPEKAKGIKPGDHVEITIAPSSMMKIYSLLYAVPLAVFISVILGVNAISHSPLISFTLAIISVVITYFSISRYIKTLSDLAPDIRVIT